MPQTPTTSRWFRDATDEAADTITAAIHILSAAPRTERSITMDIALGVLRTWRDRHVCPVCQDVAPPEGHWQNIYGLCDPELDPRPRFETT